MRMTKVRDPEEVLSQTGDPITEKPPEAETALLELGIDPADIGQVEAIIRDEALRLAAEGLRQILLLLPDTPQNVALRRAVLVDDQRSLSEDAKRCGISKQALSKTILKLKERLTGIVGARANQGSDRRAG